LLAHLFFLGQFLLIPLQFQLHLVLSLALSHFYFKLLRLALFVLSNLGLLDGQFPFSLLAFTNLTLCFPGAPGA
jgi:hypothetical protein